MVNEVGRTAILLVAALLGAITLTSPLGSFQDGRQAVGRLGLLRLHSVGGHTVGFIGLVVLYYVASQRFEGYGTLSLLVEGTLGLLVSYLLSSSVVVAGVAIRYDLRQREMTRAC